MDFAGIVLVVRRHRDSLATPLTRFFLVCMVVLAPAAFMCSLKRETSVLGVDIPMPSYLLGEITTFWRVFARFGLLVTFALAALAAFTLTVLIRRFRYGLAVAGAACSLLVFEYFSGFAPAYSFSHPDPWVGWLKQQPHGIVAHYPLPDRPSTSPTHDGADVLPPAAIRAAHVLDLRLRIRRHTRGGDPAPQPLHR